MAKLVTHQATVEQIREIEDGPVNPMTGNPWSSKHEELTKTRRQLPINQHAGKILKAYQDNDVFILSGEAGSGKSTQVPQLIAYDEYNSPELLVACTQPRRLAVGYWTDYASIQSDGSEGKGPETRIVYVTEEVLIAELKRDPKLSKYACIIVDEAHKRTMQTELLLALLKMALVARRDHSLKVVIMSATLDACIFQRYFNNAPLLSIPGRCHNVTTCYMTPVRENADMPVMAANVVSQIHRTEGKGDILVFIAGRSDIEAICDIIKKKALDIELIPLHAGMPDAMQCEILVPPRDCRRCILSTNIAETSRAIKNVVYVVDTGLSEAMVFNPYLAMYDLWIAPISQASANERQAWAGRTSDGFCYRLYTRASFEKMYLLDKPEIRISAAHQVVLHLLDARYTDITAFDWVTTPNPDTLARAVQDIYDWGLLEGNGPTINPDGRLAARLPVDPVWYRAIKQAAILGCLTEMIDIAALCSTKNDVFMRPENYTIAADEIHRVWKSCGSDHIALLEVFSAYLQARAEYEENKQWCQDHILDIVALEEAIQIKNKVWSHLSQSGMKLFETATAIPKTKQHLILKALATGMPTKLAILRNVPQLYTTVHTYVGASLLGTSAAISTTPSEWVVYTSLVSTEGAFQLSRVSPVSAEWLVKLPYLAMENVAKNNDGTLRQPYIQESLGRAQASLGATSDRR